MAKLNKEQKRLAEEQSDEIYQKLESITKEDVLTDEQLELYKKATNPRKLWMEFFIRNGNPEEATRFAYPNQNPGSQNVTTSRIMKYYGISIADVFRSVGITELKIATKTQTLLDAKRLKRTYVKGELMEETEEEDNFAISKGLDIAIKLTGNEPASKRLLGEDPNNRFKGLAELMKSQLADEESKSEDNE